MCWFSERREFVNQRVSRLFQKHSPRAKRSQGWKTDQEKHPDRLLSNAEPEPDDIRLVNEVQAIRIESNETEQSGRLFEYRNDSGDADDFEQATCARSEIDENVLIDAVVELQRCGVEDQSKN